MKFYFICFSDYKYEQYRRNLCVQANNLFDGVFEYTHDWLKTTQLYKDNEQLLKQSTGLGYFAWKPFIILETLKVINHGDIVFYLDCGDIFKNTLISFLKTYFTHNDILLVDGAYKNCEWTKYDCFHLMGCDKPRYHNILQLEAGICGFKKTYRNIIFLTEWLYWCLIEEVVGDVPNKYGNNYSNFKEHRHDQSILTNLKVKYDLLSCNSIRTIIKCNINEI